MTDELDVDTIAEQLGEELIDRILEDDRDSLDSISGLLQSGSPVWYQNTTEGISPLHAAAYKQNVDLVRLLLEYGAVWNAVDYLKNTAGDIALSFNNEEIYTLVRDAGIRSELILGLLQSKPINDASAMILRATDTSATGSSGSFLSSNLKYIEDEHGQQICILDVDGEEVGVMMGWEAGIMRETVDKLVDAHPNAATLRVLNIGFGLGIIDGLFQSLPSKPAKHVIIEAHPDVLRHMRKTGWYDKPGVIVLEGRWQEFISTPDLVAFGQFDVVYTDTFSEDYRDLRQFFEHLPGLLVDCNSRFSFFHGLGATNALFYDVYTHISEVHLAGCGFDINWSDVDVSHDSRQNRWGHSREYFSLPFYRLPIGKMATIQSQNEASVGL